MSGRGCQWFPLITGGSSVLRDPGQSTGKERTEWKGKRPQKEGWDKGEIKLPLPGATDKKERQRNEILWIIVYSYHYILL